MGFNKVYRTLQEVFPQIDPRALRAVAIEHSKDVDAAVETVLAEVIPFFTIRTRPKTPSTGSVSVGGSSKGAISNAQTANCTSVNAAAGSTDSQNGSIANVGYQQSFGDANDGRSEPFYDPHDRHCERVRAMVASALSRGEMSCDEADQLIAGVNAHQFEVSVEFKTDKTPTEGKNPESLSATNKDSEQGKTSGDGNTCGVGPASFIVRDLTASLPENNSPLLILNDKSGSDKMESTSNIADTDDDGSMSQSSKIDMIDALAKIIADARDNKKTLFSAMDSVISMMREVQHKEQAAEQAKVEAAMGSTDILVKSEELKQMVKKAEEANSTHAGEVYGEKAILASELRELQSRALSLSVERDKYLAVLDEMQQTLEVRLTEAQNVIKSAEQEKMEKEKAAMEALAEQELIMEKVLQQSKILNQQAEDNAKLREFLVDRGHVVDMLQGEISVICQDVRLLKEKFDEHIPLSKSLSSSQTSFILASSGSSSKSLISEQVEALPDEGADGSPGTQEKEGAISCSAGDSSIVQVARNDHKSLSDDEWEICDHDVPS
ncbi:hypothetical protein C2S51_036158 [Perilla frutescens var. frutescens]|nr:hypothetical protein C2S51_036158 [Perilla frutescens var. frutescens]